MFAITTEGTATVVHTRTVWVAVGAVFFLVLGVLDLVAGAVSGSIGNVFMPGVFCAIAGIVYGLIPFDTRVTIDGGSGSVTRVARSLLRRASWTANKSELRAVAILPGTNAWSFVARRDGDEPLLLVRQMKMTWTWVVKPAPEVVARAQQIADALGIPLEA